MENITLAPHKDQIADENESILRPWKTPHLQRLSGNEAAKPWTPFFETTASGPTGSGGPS